MRNAYKILVGTPEGKISLRKPGGSCEDDTKVYLTEMGRELNLIQLAQVRDQWRVSLNKVMNFWVP